MSDKSDFFCDACQLGKSHKLPFNKNVEKVTRLPGEYIHSDVCGPMSTDSLGSAKFFVTFKDDASDYRQVFLKHKSDVFESFKTFERALANKFGKVMKTLRSDNGREYCNGAMSSICSLSELNMKLVSHTLPNKMAKRKETIEL